MKKLILPIYKKKKQNQIGIISFLSRPEVLTKYRLPTRNIIYAYLRYIILRMQIDYNMMSLLLFVDG